MPLGHAVRVALAGLVCLAGVLCATWVFFTTWNAPHAGAYVVGAAVLAAFIQPMQ